MFGQTIIYKAALAQRRFLLHSIRRAATQVKTRIEKPAEIGWTTKSREEFERVFPGVAAKQAHHLRMIKEHHLPVHRSGGRSNDVVNSMFYGATAVLFAYFMYLYYEMIKSS
ncbi:uncharacterized protein LOC143458682 [Clavelina lepadiformis]|uniref:uncharacterized protein LOC143458682 n=1 Tax=Clavelina lepadiformis TaxID=159417 RepID=UPI00404126DE